MKKMTEANLKDAFAGESQASMKYSIFADKAEKDGYPEIAKLFRAISYAEKVHATNHLRELKGISTTVDNINAAKSGEDFEIDEMYPAYDVVAKLQEEKGAERSIFYAIEAEKIHSVLFGNAAEKAVAKSDLPASNVYVCPVCGHTHVGEEAPDECPICKVKKEKYIKF